MKITILFFVPTNDKPDPKIRDVMDELALKTTVKLITKKTKLLEELKQKCKKLIITVLYSASEQEFLTIVTNRSLLSDISSVIILPDHHTTTTSIGYALCPRFLTYVDSDFNELKAVLMKMIDKH